jgi:hypothetical protein
MVANKNLVFPYIELLQWLIDHTDMQKCLINDDNGECVRVFLLVEVHKYYNLRDPEQRMNTHFMVKFYEHHDTSWVMASGWREYKKFTNRTSSWYQMASLREPYIFLMALIYRLYEEKYFSRFLEGWMPLAYTFDISRSGFNWGSIISKQLSIYIQQDQMSKEGETPSFYMESFLMHIMCARNVFTGMNLRWHTTELPVHVYFNVLWEDMYKKSYSLIPDEFITRIHFILFKKECPRLLTIAKKMISKVGQWYLDEKDTYIRVFKATRAPHILPVHVPDRLVVGEIYCQTILQGYNATLVKYKKRAFIPYGFHIGFYLVKDTTQAKKEGLSQLEFLL